MADNDPNDVRWQVRAPGLVVEFHRLGDRWTHDVAVGPRGAPAVVAVAVEADAERDGPTRVVSPTYQELDFERGADRVGALLLGQAGPHHFSAVFAVWEDPGQVGVVVDVADRCRVPVESLACTYRLDLPAAALRSADPGAIAWDLPGGRLEFMAKEPARVAVAEAGRRGTLVQAEAGIDSKSHTQRCLYRWLWTPDRSNPGARS
ncbi:MAG TPA: hypothetical protein VG406_06910 [Isosphaeraceae bacterium]|jgi:hypothetical protein|nr:hypothetical protein [Isosphaeraceae bacterium]